MAKPASKVKSETYRNYINGEWVAPSSNDYIENRNPADARELVGRFPAATADDVDRAVQAAADAAGGVGVPFRLAPADDVDRAVQAAADAFTGWRKTPAPRRAEILYRAGELLVGRKDEFARQMTREMGKVLKETSGDVQEAID